MSVAKKKVDPKEMELRVVKDQLARALADYDNLRKRSEAEREAVIEFASEAILIKMIGILDMLESAEKHLKDQGLKIAIGEFKKTMNEEGVVEIYPSENDVFDPELHEVSETVEGGEEGKIIECIIPGWKFKNTPTQPDGKVIRFAKVKVYAKNN